MSELLRLVHFSFSLSQTQPVCKFKRIVLDYRNNVTLDIYSESFLGHTLVFLRGFLKKKLFALKEDLKEYRK